MLHSIHRHRAGAPAAFAGAVLAILAFAASAAGQDVPVTEGLQLWLDASDSSTVILNAGAIERWEDKSGNSYHATQATAAKRPVLNATALNGRPAVRFDGSTNDGLSIADALYLNRPYTAFIVDQYYGATQGRTLQGRDANWLMGKWGGRNGHYAGAWVYLPGAGSHSTAIGDAVGHTWANSSGYALNGTDVTGSAAPTGIPGKLGLVSEGASPGEVSDADVAEVIVYNRFLSPFERQRVGAYLGTKYGLTTTYSDVADFGAITHIHGPDDLDLDGHVRYAMNLGVDVTRTVGGVTFITDTGALPAGVSLVTPRAATGHGTKPEFGASADENALEEILHDLRWAIPSGEEIRVDLDVVTGRQYKLQLLSSENAGGIRWWDVEVEGQFVVDEMNSSGGSAYSVNQATVYTHTLTAGDSQINIRLNGDLGGTNYPGDQNPILPGFTLEELPYVEAAANGTVGTFTGGDAGEGLDLDGNFVYAVNVRGPAAGAVRDATFTDDSAPGVTIAAGAELLNWITPNYGITTNDDNLETVLQSIRNAGANPGTVTIDLANLEIGKPYKLQLLFAEGCCNRGFDVLVEGGLVADEFSPLALQEGVAGNSALYGTVVTHEFTAGDTTLNIVLSGAAASFPDQNPIIQGLTLELVPEPGALLLAVMGLVGLAAFGRRRK